MPSGRSIELELLTISTPPASITTSPIRSDEEGFLSRTPNHHIASKSSIQHNHVTEATN